MPVSGFAGRTEPGSPEPPEGYVLIGRLGRPFQLAGGVTVTPLGAPERAALSSLRAVFIPVLGHVQVERIREVSGRSIVSLRGVETREAAAKLTHQPVYAALAELPSAGDRPYKETLVGRTVAVGDQPIGLVTDVIEASGYGILVVAVGDDEVLLPAAADYVRIDERQVTLVDPPEGLLTLHQPGE